MLQAQMIREASGHKKCAWQSQASITTGQDKVSPLVVPSQGIYLTRGERQKGTNLKVLVIMPSRAA